MAKAKRINFALLGLGKLGLGFCEVLQQKKSEIKLNHDIELSLRHILVKNKHFKRPSNINHDLITTDISDILNDSKIDVVIDAMGGIEPVFSILKQILSHGVHLISANRTLLASKMHELSDIAINHQSLIFPESSLGGGLPIISTVQKDLVANKVFSVTGILSGTSNFILSEMTQKKISLKEVLRANDLLKMSESLSIVDYEGSDAAQKVAILAAAALGVDINYLDIPATGISDITRFDIQSAAEFGYEFKLLAIIKEHKSKFEIHVHPTLVPKEHPLTLIRGDQNAYFLETDLMGSYMMYGRGIGAEAASSLIIRDLIDLGNTLRFSDNKRTTQRLNWNNKPLMPIESTSSAFYVRFPCLNQPGVVGKITTAMGQANINLASAHAEVDKEQFPDIGFVHILIDQARESALLGAIKAISKLNIIKGRIKYFRILRSII